MNLRVETITAAVSFFRVISQKTPITASLAKNQNRAFSSAGQLQTDLTAEQAATWLAALIDGMFARVAADPDFHPETQTQSIVPGILFTGYGLRLMTELSSSLIVLVVIVTYIMQLWLSTLWMRRHQYGPLEWLLRSVTIMSLPVWRRIA
jgi:hypothetical protein